MLDLGYANPAITVRRNVARCRARGLGFCDDSYDSVKQGKRDCLEKEEGK